MIKRRFTLHVACVMLLASLFVAGQTLHAAAAMFGPCYLKAVAHKHMHMGSTGQRSTHQGGCCCDRPTPCDCDLNQGSNDEGSALPVTAATNSISPTSLNAWVLPARIAAGSYSPEKGLCPGWVQARAPSETLPPDTTKLIC
jgi:hypothetical protein